jgi:hypothetical protein
MLKRANLLGAVVTSAIYLFSTLTFISRLLGNPELGIWFGYPLLLTALPLVYLLFKAPWLKRPVIYYVQISLMIVFLLVELILDYVFKLDFRHTQWIVICYVMLFFGATGGMLGVASYADRKWKIMTVTLFFVMAILAFVQRSVTGNGWHPLLPLKK